MFNRDENIVGYSYKERKTEPFSWRDGLPEEQKTWKPEKKRIKRNSAKIGYYATIGNSAKPKIIYIQDAIDEYRQHIDFIKMVYERQETQSI